MEILYEDNHVIVVLKPQNVPSQEDASKDKDLLTMVKEYIKEKYNKPGNVYVGLVHRLDRPTGGIMVFAKTSKAAARLSEQFKNGEAEKTYFAVVKGNLKLTQTKLVNYLLKDETNNKVRVVPMSTAGAKRAELDYTLLESREGLHLLKVKLATGRGHQIRVQLSTIGNPIVGDQKYGGENMEKVNLNLFAVELKFYHPTTKDKMVFRAYPPEQKTAWNLFNLEKHISLR
ncbi:MAG: RluA family pseudouridine synthase [Clostridia bacterium]|nr:RluA family pseudouridine synthase [Clostridia bacterium]